MMRLVRGTIRGLTNKTLPLEALPTPWQRLGQAYSQCLQYLRRLQFIEQRRRLVSFGGRGKDHDDIFSTHPRTLADLKRRRDDRAG
jgi:hypothetical protein